MRRYNHIGIPTDVPRAGETYLERYGLHCTDHESNHFGILWMRYDPGCPLPDLVKSTPHVAFEVDDLTAELVGREVIIEPNSPSDGVLVAFMLEDDAPVELMQFDESFRAPSNKSLNLTPACGGCRFMRRAFDGTQCIA